MAPCLPNFQLVCPLILLYLFLLISLDHGFHQLSLHRSLQHPCWEFAAKSPTAAHTQKLLCCCTAETLESQKHRNTKVGKALIIESNH